MNMNIPSLTSTGNSKSFNALFLRRILVRTASPDVIEIFKLFLSNPKGSKQKKVNLDFHEY